MAMTAFRLVPLLWVVAGAAAAQPAGLIDEASFTISRAGMPFGTESFKIVRRLGAEGIEYVAQCTRTIDGQVIKTALTTDSAGNPTNYSRSVTGGSGGKLSARRSLNRLTVDEEGGRASTKDYVFGAASLILDDDLLHQLYFVTWRALPRAIGYVAPGARTSSEDALVEIGRETVTIAGQRIPAWRFAFGTGATRRDIWIDSGKRLLRVSVPAQQIEGTRDLPPL